MSKSNEKLHLWKERIDSHRKSGLSATAWCRENNTSVNTFLYWRSKLEKPFRELVDEDPLSGIYISLDGKIEIRKQFDGFTLREVMKCLRNSL